MNKIKILLAIMALICSMAINAQEIQKEETTIIIANEDSCSTERIQSAIDACIQLAEACAYNDSIGLNEAIYELLYCNIGEFESLRQIDKEVPDSLKGHLVFDKRFAIALASGIDPYQNADDFNGSNTKTHTDNPKRPILHDDNRYSLRHADILTKTCLVKANGKAVYEFGSKGRQELAVVAEPGGLVSTRIHVTNKEKGINEWHNDTVDVAKGRNSRKASFTMPEGCASIVTIEITNCTEKDISVVVISNFNFM